MRNYDGLVPKDENSDMIRVRLEGDLKKRWRKLLDDRKISQQKAIVSIIEWMVEQEPLLQLMLFGQVPQGDHADLAKLALKRLESPSVPAYGGLIAPSSKKAKRS